MVLGQETPCSAHHLNQSDARVAFLRLQTLPRFRLLIVRWNISQIGDKLGNASLCRKDRWKAWGQSKMWASLDCTQHIIAAHYLHFSTHKIFQTQDAYFWGTRPTHFFTKESTKESLVCTKAKINGQSMYWNQFELVVHYKAPKRWLRATESHKISERSQCNRNAILTVSMSREWLCTERKTQLSWI